MTPSPVFPTGCCSPVNWTGRSSPHGRADRRSRCCSSTSTTSNPLTTTLVTMPVTRCCGSSRNVLRGPSARKILRPGSAVTSSGSCCVTRTRRPPMTPPVGSSKRCAFRSRWEHRSFGSMPASVLPPRRCCLRRPSTSCVRRTGRCTRPSRREGVDPPWRSPHRRDPARHRVPDIWTCPSLIPVRRARCPSSAGPAWLRPIVFSPGSPCRGEVRPASAPGSAGWGRRWSPVRFCLPSRWSACGSRRRNGTPPRSSA